MATDEEEARKIHWGLKAKSLIENDSYIEMFEFMKQELATEILDTPLTSKDYREELFITFHGMRAFGNRLTQLVVDAHHILAARDEDIIKPSEEDE